MKLPNKIKIFRLGRELSQTEFAKLADIRGSRSYVSILENKSPLVSFKTIYRISKALKAKPSEIFLFDELYS